MTKIRYGDTVTVEFVVKRVSSTGEINANVKSTNSGNHFFPSSAVVKHTPLPREIKVGDKMSYDGSQPYTFLGSVDGHLVYRSREEKVIVVQNKESAINDLKNWTIAE